MVCVKLTPLRRIFLFENEGIVKEIREMPEFQVDALPGVSEADHLCWRHVQGRGRMRGNTWPHSPPRSVCYSSWTFAPETD